MTIVLPTSYLLVSHGLIVGMEIGQMKLQEDLYVYLWKSPHENNCNSYIIGGEVTVLIDPGHSHLLPRLFSQMEEDHLSPEDLDLVLITHAHPDHIEGIESLQDKDKQLKTAMGGEEERYLRESGKVLFDETAEPRSTYRIDLYLKEGDLRLGEKRFTIIATPGHSPGSVSIYWADRKALFTGDVVFYGGIGRTDFTEGDSKALMQSIERLSRLETEVLLPGHGEIVVGREAVAENFETIRRSFYPYL